MAKNEFWSKNFFRENDVFNFTSFFLAWTFLKFLSDCEVIFEFFRSAAEEIFEKYYIIYNTASQGVRYGWGGF